MPTASLALASIFKAVDLLSYLLFSNLLIWIQMIQKPWLPRPGTYYLRHPVLYDFLP